MTAAFLAALETVSLVVNALTTFVCATEDLQDQVAAFEHALETVMEWALVLMVCVNALHSLLEVIVEHHSV